MIKQIQIKNYKTCKNVKIVMKEPVMALIGRNAAGKTNTLKGIQLASRQIWTTLSQAHEEKPGKDFSGEFVFQHKKDELVYRLKIYGKKSSYVRDSLRIKVDNEKFEVFNKKSKVGLKIIGHENLIILPAEVSGLQFMIGIMLSKKEKPKFMQGALKYQPQTISIVRELFMANYYAVYDQANLDPIRTEEFEEWKKKPLSERPKNHFSCQFYDFYKNRSDDFAEYVSLAKSLGLVKDIIVTDTVEFPSPKMLGKFCFFLFEVFDVPLFYGELSDGTKRVLRLLFHLLYDQPSLMLIEEPESSIHYGLLGKLLSILHQYANDRKILITTHSEQILNQLKPEQLIYLFNEGGNTKVKYVTGRTFNGIRKYLKEIGPLGEYVTSGALEADLED